ncbi:programmed cell death protein 2 [Adelges cooleyi]|uniref:programmed cell death protein 2 n=1 Tax=Adelges cooleyi TaxID=133065 RepID=UPI0021808D61|nr:programmed cell death protein 2 [Adelges cooleyi]
MSVMLGTIDKNSTTDQFKLTSRFFPSKVGGMPAWLDFKHIPDATEMTCSKCNVPLVFLCQLYAPIDEPEFRGSCFHRTLFVFFCYDCRNDRTFLVLRSQLRVQNEYYSDVPAEPSDPDKTPDMWGVKLCKVCGCKALEDYENIYCSLYHKNVDDRSSSDNNLVVLPEYIINEEADDDEYPDGSSASEDEESNDDENSEVVIPKGSLQDVDNLDEALLEMAYGGDQDDEYFEKFKTTIASVPEQIIRYDRLGKPLWVCAKSIPATNDIPPCSYCGKQRQFEFQIMPQVLYYLKLPEITNEESFNFGVLAVYTCPDSCSVGSKQYKEEFLWQQSSL